MKRAPLRRRASLRAKTGLRRTTPLEKRHRWRLPTPSARQWPAGCASSAGPIAGSTRHTCYPEERPLGCAFFLLVLLSVCRQRSG